MPAGIQADMDVCKEGFSGERMANEQVPLSVGSSEFIGRVDQLFISVQIQPCQVSSAPGEKLVI